ncbi:MAG: putative rane-bound protein with a domain [Anaerocolumna sp.]|jgi:diguanylate cyclase (GGDEF)-like protein|nr:putative rane-bound protein with a domain [Anaerocolumna sp.]
MGKIRLREWFRFDLTDETKLEFDVNIYRLNVIRAKAILKLLIIVEIALILYYSLFRIEELGLSPIRYFFGLSVVMLILSLFFISLIYAYGNKVKENLKKLKIIGFFYIIVILTWCMVVTLLYQLSSGDVVVYITGALAISILSIIHPFKMILILVPVHTIFLTLLPVFQPSSSRIFENVVITTVSIVVSLIISREFYKSKIDDFKIKKSFKEQNIQLTRANLELEKVNHKLEQLSYTDSLTGLLNRRKFDEVMRMEWERCRRYGVPISLIMIDIDYYKNFNDLYGHQAGDECITKITCTISNLVRRSTDIIARYGGEEFIVALPHITGGQAYELAENIRIAIEELEIPHGASVVSDYVTISLGVGTLTPNQNLSYYELIESADTALYRAKVKRNHTVSLEMQKI